MKKEKTIPFVLFIAGLLLTGIAVFAEIVGLDKAPGDWGRTRVSVFVAGIFSLLFAYVYARLIHKLNAVLSKFWFVLQKNRVVIWFLENETIQHKLRLTWDYFLTASILVAMLTFYAWLASSGRWISWESSTTYYSSLAKSFLNGNLYLHVQPDPQLLALEDPYDPLARAGIETPVDLSFYEGKFYMYWGPIPSLFIAGIQIFIHEPIGDFIVTFVFVYGIFLAQSALLFTIWKRWFSTLPKSTLYLMILLGGLTGPIILLRHNYENAKIYEAAISGGQFFLVSGVLVAFSVITKKSIIGWRLFFAGILWTLAIGTRQILAIPIGGMAILMALQINVTESKTFQKVRKLMLLGLPLLLGFVVLCWYNWARFNSITETGLYYQLAAPDIQENYTELFSRSYIVQNLYNYFFNPPDITSKFPFFFMHKGSSVSILPFYSVPEFYSAQPITGIIYIFPFAVFSILFLTILSLDLYNRRYLADSISDSKYPNSLKWVSLISVGSCLAFFPIMAYFWAGMRFLVDFLPGLMILSALGFWQGYILFANKPLVKCAYTFLGVSLAGMSILISILLAISTNSKLVNLIVRNFPFLR